MLDLVSLNGDGRQPENRKSHRQFCCGIEYSCSAHGPSPPRPLSAYLVGQATMRVLHLFLLLLLAPLLCRLGRLLSLALHTPHEE